MASDFWNLTAGDIAQLVCRRTISARQVTEAFLARIEALEPRVNAFIHVAAEDALAQAEHVDRTLADGREPGPLAGVPVSVKDLVHVAGMPTSFGSAVYAGQPAPGDAVPVARLRTAGAILVGKTTTPEFGHKAITESPLFGRTLNPWNPAFTSGGSSGGAAASVASREVPLAIGTDGGGSIRIPASACGIFGLKPTLGRIPHIHAADLFANNAYIGPMARNAADLGLMYGVMAGAHPQDPWSKALVDAGPAARLGKLRIGWMMRVGNPAVETGVRHAFEVAISRLDVLGQHVVELELDLHRHEPSFRVILETALAARFGHRLADDRNRFDPSFVETLERGRTYSGVDVQTAAATRSEMFRAVEALFEEVDLIVTPTLAAASVPADTNTHADIVVGGVNSGRIRAGWYPYTWPFNLTGHPAISLPCGWAPSGLPVGLQIVGRWYEEDLLLAAARTLAEALDVAERIYE